MNKLVKCLLLILSVIIIGGCSSSKMSVKKTADAGPVRYTLVYVIHGDANYLYHDADGNSLQADEHILKTAKRVARHATHGQVFIFHQKPERKILWLFPKKDRQFLYYRNGKLKGRKFYSPHASNESFVTEANLYHRYAAPTEQDGRRMFLYFGHEVPARPAYPYHYSRPDVPFDRQIFVAGMASFIKPGGDPFNLVMLSTCNNGTPSMVQALAPYARYILASPQNLHLSHINTGQLATLLEKPDLTTRQIADSLASRTFKRLSSFLQTAVTLSVYDTQKMRSYLPALARKYRASLKTKSLKELLNDNNDCRKRAFTEKPLPNEGVETWYKPARFGHKKDASDRYSGWGCK